MSDENKKILLQLKEIRQKQLKQIPLNSSDIQLINIVKSRIQGISKQRFLKNLSESTSDSESDIDTLIEQIIKNH
ncbi:TPA: hypothetical protein CPT80_03745 [Candidatus Gastranaerophilales bacterium HUM_9]|nr:MAG TPA: hypothetical protein CPT80_03745 [Candidatus Gastranaerophilales bacterium HUM_9]HBX35365.1 hypothetical protein [Cyanobacteria bacterium UBA11440]